MSLTADLVICTHIQQLLGWLVTEEGLRIDPSKVTGILEWPRMLTSVRQVRKTLGVSPPIR
jgi:hypothetical protein